MTKRSDRTTPQARGPWPALLLPAGAIAAGPAVQAQPGDRPVALDTSTEGRQQNHRVELVRHER